MNYGIITSNGISFGIAYVIENKNIFKKKYINKNEVLFELKKFSKTYEDSINDLKKIRERANKIFENDEDQIFEGQMLLLEDEFFIEDIKKLINNDLYSCEMAINCSINNRIKEIEKINDKYLSSRTIDLKDIGNRLINNIYKNNNKIFLNKINNDDAEKIIIISKDILPSYILQIDIKKISGIISYKGNYNSHSSIIARSLEIPMIVGIKNVHNIIKNNNYIIIDALNNNVLINPNSDVIFEYQKIQSKYFKEKDELSKLNFLESKTLDNFKINLLANINTSYDIDRINNYNIDGIGLYRTEFLFMNRNSIPTEEEQFNQYKKLAINCKDKIFTIRVLDIGGDKNINYINYPKEENPYLGLRGIRFLLRNNNILISQLKSIFRASYFGNIRIMFPMISVYEEILELKNIINDIKNEFFCKKVPFNENIKVGIMIEVPSILFNLKTFSKELDFFSIGTNDLLQYFLAVDRNNKNISYLYNSLYPSFLRFIKNIIDILNIENKELCLCGEMASDEKNLILLLGLGIRNFSVNISSISIFKKILKNINLNDSKKISDKILFQDKLEDVIKILNQFNN